MKKVIKIFIIVAAAFFAAENTADAQLLKNLLNKTSQSTSTEANTATSEGKQAGIALKALYTQYKADGKFDMTNLNNLMNLTKLSNNIKGLKGKSNKSSFYKDFLSGLIIGSDNLVNKNNSTEVMNGLTDLINVDVSGLTQKTKETQSKATEVLSAVSDILSVFK
jgi:hypothetical protein